MCRREGLAGTRNCGWIGAGAAQRRVVWARAGKSIATCPKSYITADSVRWLELFHVRRLLGLGDVSQMDARDVEALCVLENELNAERRREQE